VHGFFLNAVEKSELPVGESQHQAENHRLTLCNVLDMSLLDAARLCTFSNKSAFDEVSTLILDVSSTLEDASSVLEDVRPLTFDVSSTLEDASSVLEDVRPLTFDVSSLTFDVSSVLEDVRPLTSFRRPFNKLTRTSMPSPSTVVFEYIRLTR
jgi:hypothetical protein